MDQITVRKAQDCTVEVMIFAGSGRGLGNDLTDFVHAQLAADALAGATTLTVRPLEDDLASGDMLLFGKNTVVTLSGAAAAGTTTIAVNAIPGLLRSGEVGKKLQDLTGFTVEAEVLANRGDAAPIISKTGGSVTLLNQAQASGRGRVQIALAAADTSGQIAGSYYGSVWRRNVGSARQEAEFDFRIVEAGFL